MEHKEREEPVNQRKVDGWVNGCGKREYDYGLREDNTGDRDIRGKLVWMKENLRTRIMNKTTFYTYKIRPHSYKKFPRTVQKQFQQIRRL